MQRRLQLNLSIKRAAVMAELSKDTWMRVENGDAVRHMTYDKVEGALDWTIGSCRKIIEGGEPALLDPELNSDVEYASVPPAELEERIRQAVQGAMVAVTDDSASVIRDVNDRAIQALRAAGVLPEADWAQRG